MKDQAKRWFRYADENLRSAHVLLETNLFNPCLQNIQQAVEKFLKALSAEFSIAFKKTHSINELREELVKVTSLDLMEDECDLLDSIYLPSKYPLGSALPDFDPDKKICSECITIAERVRNSVIKRIPQ